jgi:F-type H+-transporting ATPase subunit delta
MSEYRVAARYAKSLLDLAKEQNNVDAVLNDMRTFARLVADNKEMALLLNSPIINGDKKLSVLKSIFEASFQKVTIAFLDVIIRKKREAFLEAVANGFIEQFNTLNNIATATVKSAVPLSDAVVAEIKSHIESQTGKAITLTASVNPDLIGGVVVQVGDKLFDASVAGKLGKLKHELLNSYISK